MITKCRRRIHEGLKYTQLKALGYPDHVISQCVSTFKNRAKAFGYLQGIKNRKNIAQFNYIKND